MTQSAPEARSATDSHAVTVFGRAGWIVGVVATLLGLFGLIFPQTGLAIVGLLIGIYLVAAGIIRVATAVSTKEVPTAWRWVLGIIGVLLAVAGVLTLNHPFGTLLALVIVIGIGWIIDGVGYLMIAFTTGRGGSMWALGLVGALLVVAGIILIAVPAGAVGTAYLLASVLLLVIGVVTIVTLAISKVRAKK